MSHCVAEVTDANTLPSLSFPVLAPTAKLTLMPLCGATVLLLYCPCVVISCELSAIPYSTSLEMHYNRIFAVKKVLPFSLSF